MVVVGVVCVVYSRRTGAPVRLGTGTTPGARLQMGAAESNYLLRLSVPLGILAGLRRIVLIGLGRVARALGSPWASGMKTLAKQPQGQRLCPLAVKTRRSCMRPGLQH